MAVEQTAFLDTEALKSFMGELYTTCLELNVLARMWEEMSTGPRNANDAHVLYAINQRVRALRLERAALHKAIHELPEKPR